MTNYARMYRFGITPWEGYRTVAAARISALRDREETERSRPSRPCARPRLRSRSVHPRARAEGVGGRRHRLCAGRVRGGGSKEPERGRAQLRRRRRDAAAVGPAGDVRLLPRHRLLPGFGRRTAPLPGGRCLCACQPRGNIAAAELRAEQVAVVGRRSIAAGVETAFGGWEMLAVEPADTAGLGWPINKTAPRWYRLRLRT
jgi:hypothetical protein